MKPAVLWSIFVTLTFPAVAIAAVEQSSVSQKVHCVISVPGNTPIPLTLESDLFVKVYGAMFAAVERLNGAINLVAYQGWDLAQAYQQMVAAALKQIDAQAGSIPLVSPARAARRKREYLERISRIFQKVEVRIYEGGNQITPDSGIKLIIKDSLHWDGEEPNQVTSQTVKDGTGALFYIPYLKRDMSEGSVQAQVECAIER